VASQGGDPVLVGAPANFAALTTRAREALVDRQELVIVCAGRERQFALEDAYSAGRLVKAVKKGLGKLELNDAAHAALALTRAYDDWADALSGTVAARQLVEANLGGDVEFCAKPNRFGVVPQYAERSIT
jgi:phosphosulfolactate phosphohydrolase-like enzyme